MKNMVNKAERSAQLRAAKVIASKLWSALQSAERLAKTLAGAADAEYRDCSCCSAEREAQFPPHANTHWPVSRTH